MTSKHPHERLSRFASLTKVLIRQGKIQRVKTCFQIAERLLLQGEAKTRNAVINVYLFSVSSFAECGYRSLLALLPPSLRRAYHHQIYASGL